METAFVLYSKPSSASYLKTSPWREILALFTADRISVFIFGFKAAGNCIKEMFDKAMELLACETAVSGDTGPSSNGLLFVGFCRVLRRAVLISFCCFWIWKKALKCELKMFYSLKINLHYTLLSFPLDTRLSSCFSSHETEILTSSTLVVLYKVWE